jgi:hypothetical protein
MLCDAWLLLHRIKDFMPPKNAISSSGGEVVPTINVDGTQQIDAFNERGGCPYAGSFQETLDHDISTHVNFPASMSGSPLSEYRVYSSGRSIFLLAFGEDEGPTRAVALCVIQDLECLGTSSEKLRPTFLSTANC